MTECLPNAALVRQIMVFVSTLAVCVFGCGCGGEREFAEVEGR